MDSYGKDEYVDSYSKDEYVDSYVNDEYGDSYSNDEYVHKITRLVHFSQSKERQILKTSIVLNSQQLSLIKGKGENLGARGTMKYHICPPPL